MEPASNMARSQTRVPDELMPWLPDASARFGYLHPGVVLNIKGSLVEFAGQGADAPTLLQDFLFCLYRQKIYSETLIHRRMLIEGVTGFANRTT
jgi:hypothetical protein